MPVLPIGGKHVLSSPTSSTIAGPPPSKRSRVASGTTSGITPLQLRRPAISSVALAAGFPEFSDGDVEIILPSGRRYQLHRATLTMNSQYFRRALAESHPAEKLRASSKKGTKRKKTEDDETEDGSPIRYRFRLEGRGRNAVLKLQEDQHMGSTDSGLGSQSERAGSVPPNMTGETIVPVPAWTCFNCNTSLEEAAAFGHDDICQECGVIHPSDPSGLDVYLQTAYDNMFLMFYNFAPCYLYRGKVAPQEQNYYRLVEIAEAYGALRAISSHIWRDLSALGDSLWLRVFWDPISWAGLATKIRVAEIFREASIHLIGRGLILTQLDRLRAVGVPNKAITIMQYKYNEVVRIGHITERQLHAINYANDPTPYNHENTDSTNWLALSLFRSFDSDHIAAVHGRDQLSVISSFERPELTAAYFRKYAYGGESYLNEDELHHFMTRTGYVKHFQDLADGIFEGESPVATGTGLRRDITILKETAKAIVEPICTNESRLSVQELEKRGGGYLTCVRWKDEELPWANEGDDTW